MGFGIPLRALRADVRTMAAMIVAAACRSEVARLVRLHVGGPGRDRWFGGRLVRQPRQYGRLTEAQCYLLQSLEQRVIADQGLLAYFFFDQNLTDLAFFQPSGGITDINFDWSSGTPDASVIPAGSGFSARWTGTFTVGTPGNYGFAASFSDGMRLKIDGQTVVGQWPTLAGDADGNGIVDLGDMNAVLNNFGLSPATRLQGDLDGNGSVDLSDLNFVFNTFGQQWGHSYIDEWGEKELSSGSHSFELDFFNHDGPAFLNLSMYIPESPGGGMGMSPTPIGGSVSMPAPVVVGWPTTVAGVEGTAVKIQASFGKPTSAGVTASVEWNDPGVANKPPTLTYTASHTGKLSASHTYASSGTYAATLTITGPTGTNNYPFTVTVTDAAAAPRATFANAGPARVGSPATVTFSNVYEPSGADPAHPVHYSVSLSQGGLATTYAAATDPASRQITFTSPGTHTVYGRVIDRNGKMSVDYQTDITVVDVSAVGDTTAAAGAPYTLNLVAQGASPTGWTVNWDDGSDPDGDGVVGQSIWGSPSSVVHVYASAASTRTVRTTALFDGGSFAAAPFAVEVRPGLVISGPEAAVAGDPLTYTVAGLDPSDPAPIWTVTVDGTQYTTGIGRALNFVPDRPGNYLVDVVARKGGDTLGASTGVAVSSAAVKASIAGPALLFMGRPGVFSSTVTGALGTGGSLTYHWSIGTAEGNPQTKFGLYKSTGDLSSFVVPAGLEPGAYTVILRVDDGRGGVAVEKRKFEILADPSEANYDRGFVPVETTQSDETRNVPYAIAQQADKKILVAGRARNMGGLTPNTDAAFIARFNSDLTLDTTFGREGVIVNALGGLPGQYYDSNAWVVSVDPVTQNIVVTGTVAIDSGELTGLAVARYLPDGTMDPTFHGGKPWTYLPPSWGSWSTQYARWDAPAQPLRVNWSGSPYDVVVLPDQSILVGGSRTKYWGNGTNLNWDYHQDDFLLLKLSASGSLDTGFGDGGFARTVNPMELPDGTAWDQIPADMVGVPAGLDQWPSNNNLKNLARISRVIPQFNNAGELVNILVGGSAFDWANTSDDAPYAGHGMNFVVAQYRTDGTVADGTVGAEFGDGGKVATDFGTVMHPLGGNPQYYMDDFFSNMEILPGGGILAVGSAPSHTMVDDHWDGQATSLHVPQVLAMAWYTPNGAPDHTMGASDGPSHHTGTFLSSIVVEGVGVGYVADSGHRGAIAVTFQPSDGKIVLSLPSFATWGGNFGHFPWTAHDWGMMRVLTDGELYSGTDVFDEADVRDTDFGSVGDGSVYFSDPAPFLVVRPPGTIVDGGTINGPAYQAKAILATEDGIIAVGRLDLADWNDPKYHNSGTLPTRIGSTSMVVRYRSVNPTPTNLAAVGTGQKSVSLSWDAPTEGAWYGYLIERAQADEHGAPGAFAAVGYAGQGATSYADADPSLKPGTTYFYRVHAIDGRFSPGNPSGSVVPTFAGPAQASTLPDLSNYDVVETISLHPDGTTVRSGTTLVEGVKYILRASGSFYALGPDGTRYLLDSEYVLANHLWENTQTTSSGGTVDVGVAVNGPGTLRFYRNAYTVGEDDGTVDFTVVRTGGLVGPLTFAYDITGSDAGGGTAAPGINYTAVQDTVTIPDGVSTYVIHVPILDDNVITNELNFTLNLRTAAGAAPYSSAKVTVRDADAPVTFKLATGETTVRAGRPAVITVSRVGRSTGTATVVLSTMDLSASAGTDYTAVDNVTYTFPDGITSLTVPIDTFAQPLANPIDFFVELSLPAGDIGNTIGSPGQTLVTIVDQSSVETFGLSSTAYSAKENAGYAVVVVQRSGPADDEVHVPYTIGQSGDTATYGIDYSGVASGELEFLPTQTEKAIRIPLVNDGHYELDKGLTVSLGTPTEGAQLGTSSAVVTIRDDDPKPAVSFSAPSYVVAESEGIVELTVIRSGNLDGSLTVDYQTAAGTATDPYNFEGTWDSVTFGDGEASRPIQIVIHADPAATGTLDFRVDLMISSATEVLPGEYMEVTVEIDDDLQSPTLQFASQSFTVYETSVFMLAKVVRTGDVTQAVSVDYTTRDLPPGTAWAAAAGVDYATTSGTLTFAAGQTTATIIVPVFDDNVPEGENAYYYAGREFFEIVLSNPVSLSGAGPTPILGTRTTASGNIVDEDPRARIFIGKQYYSVATNETLIVSVFRVGADDFPVTVDYTTVEFSYGSMTDAVEGVDYTPVSGTLTFAPGVFSQQIAIPVTSSALYAKKFGLHLSNPSVAGVIDSPWDSSITILPPVTGYGTDVHFDALNHNVLAGTPATLTLTRTGNLSQPTKVYWYVPESAWWNGGGYSFPVGHVSDNMLFSECSTRGVVVFRAGQATATITVPAQWTTPPWFRVEIMCVGGTSYGVVSSLPEAIVTIDQGAGEVNLLPVADTPHQYGDSVTITAFRTGPIDQAALVHWEASAFTFSHGQWFDSAITSGTIIFQPNVSQVQFTVSAYIPEHWGTPSVPPPRDGILVKLSDPVGTGIASSSSTLINYKRRLAPESVVAPAGLQQEPGASFAMAALAGGLASQSVGFTSNNVYLVNEGAGTIELTVRRSGDVSGPLTVRYSTTPGSAGSGLDYAGVTDEALTFDPGEVTQTITLHILPDELAEAAEQFSVTLSNPDDPDTIDLAWGTATVIIAPLTDSSKQPYWGPHSEASDHGYEVAVDRTQADPDGHLVLNYRNGAFTDFTTDADGEHQVGTGPIQVQIWAPRPDAVAQLTAVPHWATSPSDRWIGLSWRAPQGGGVGAQEYYEIERSENGGAFEFLARVAPGTTSYADTTAAQDAAYAYRVTVHAGALDSNPSNTAYAMLANRAPRVEFIGTQLVRPGDADFEYAVVGFDAEDGKNLHYLPLTVVDGNNAPAPGILSIKEDTGVITQHSGWVPAATDIGKSYKVTVHAADQTGQTTDRTFSLAVVARPLSLPDVGAIGAAFSPDGTLATLTSGAPSGMVYRWHFIPAAGGPDATILDPTAQNPTMTFTKAGDYTVTLQVTRPDAVASSVTVRGTIHVDSLATHVLVTEAPGDVDPTVAMGPARFPADPAPIAVGTSATEQHFMATVYDQFGDKLDSTDSDHVHPNMYWKLRDPFGSVVRESAQAGSTVKMGAQAGQVGRYTLTATQGGLTGSIVVSYADVDAPSVEILPDGTTLTGLRLKADNLVYNGTAEQRDGLQYYWSAVGHPEIGFASNGTSAAKETVAIFPHAGTYDAGLHFQLTVVDPRNGLRSAPADYVTPDPVTFVAEATALRVTPARPTVAPGGYVDLKVTLVDQFGNAMAEQPTEVTWELDALGNLVTPDDNELPDPTSIKVRYRPGTPPPSSSSILGTVSASVDDGTFSAVVPLNLRVQAPPTVSLKVATVRDPLATDGGGGGVTNLVDRPQAVSAVIVDPTGGALEWTLTAMPEGADEGSVPTLLFKGTGPAGALPGVFARIGTLAPTQLPDGVYTITLTATSDLGDSFVEGSSSQVVQVRSAVKLGNLTLPVTDLSQDVPNDLPVTVSRNYDSQRAGQNGPLGYGWTLDALTPALTSTQTVQYFDQPNPTSTDGTPGTSLAMNDLIYVTLPSGERHAFAFRPLPLIDMSQLGAGLVLGAVTYAPHFVPVDGSGATLEPSDVHGDLRTDETLLWDSADGGYAFKSNDKPLGYNPGLSAFGGYYVMTTVDGTRYVVNAATGRLHTRTDLQNRTQTYDGGEDGTISTTQGTRQYEAAPTDWDGERRITRMVTRVTAGGTTTDLQEAIYGYDTHGDLISVDINDAITHAPLRSTRYTYVDHRLTGVIDGLGVTVLSAAYDPNTGQLSQLTNTKGVGAKASTGSSGESAAETVTDPAGNQVYNQYDDHGNVIRTITTVTDPSGKVPQYYVVTVSDYLYASPQATDNARNPDGTIRYVSGTEYEDYWPTVNVLEHAYTSAPFVVPAARAGDRFLGVDALQARGYLKSDSRGILWASKQEYNTERRVLDSTSVLQGDGSYMLTRYTGGYFEYGKPQQVEVRLVLSDGTDGGRVSMTSYTYAPATRPDGDGHSQPNPNAGLVTSAHVENGQTTTYLYGGDGIPGTGEGVNDQTPAPAPAGMLYGTYRDMISDEVTGRSTPLWLTVNHYYGYGESPSFTPATATTPGGLTGLLASTTDFTADPLFSRAYDPADPSYGQPVNGVTTLYTYWPGGQVADVYKVWQDADSTRFKVLQSHTEYDALGRVSKVYSQPDRVTDIPDDGDGPWKVFDMAGPASPHTTTTYDKNGQVLDTTDTYGGVTHRVYDASGHLVQTLYPDHSETRTVYDGQGRVTWQTDRFVSSTAYTPTTGEVASDNAATANATRTIYDGQGRAIATERHASVQISMAADPVAPAGTTIYTSSLASAGTKVSVTSTAHDALGRVVQTTDAAGLRTGTVYYDDGRVHYTGVLKETASDKGASPWYAGVTDDPGLRLKFKRTNVTGTFRAGETVTQDSTGAKATFIADDGAYFYLRSLSGTWDSSHVVRSASGGAADAAGSTTTQLDDLFVSYTTYAYNQVGTDLPGTKMYDAVTDALGHTTRTYTDDQGRSSETLFADGSYDATEYSTPGTPISAWPINYAEGWTWRQDDSDPTSAMRLPIGYSEVVKVAQRKAGDPAQATVYVYDPAGRLTDVWLPAVDDAITPETTAVRPHWQYTYDVNGNQLTQKDPKGHTTSFTYDERGNRRTRTLPGGETEYWTYGTVGRTETHTDFKGQVTAYVYDDDSPEHGRRLEEERRYTSTSAYTTDPAHPAERTVYQYDDLERVEQVDEYVGAALTRSEMITYDPATGQIASVATPEGAIHYAYDPATGRHTRTWTDHNDTAYDYDAQGRLWHVMVTKLNDQDISQDPQVTTYAYDTVGNLKTVTQPNSLVTIYTYDDLYRLDLETVTVNGSTLATYDYHVRSDGLRDWVEEHQKETDGTFSDVRIMWDYDAGGRLISEFRDDHTGSHSLSNDGTPNDPGDYKEVFAYDLNGNRVSKDHDESGTAHDQSVTYTFNDNDQLLTETATGADAYVTRYGHYAGGTLVPGYDANGSPTEEVRTGTGPKSATYTWDLRNRMTSAAIDGATIGYAYDSAGNRVSRTDAGGTATSLIDANNPTGYVQILEETKGGSRTSYVLGTDVLAQSTDGSVSQLTYDGHGSTRLLLDANGIVTDSFHYTAFGLAIGFDASTASTRLLYDGEAFDAGIQRYHLRARDYDPAMGRFPARDSIIFAPGDFGNAHLYVFARNNPTNLIDPTGHFSLGSMLTTANIARVGLGMAFGASGSWNLVMAGMDVQRAYASIGTNHGDLKIIGWMALSILHTYTGLVNIQTANLLLFGAPTPPIPPNGLAVLRAALATAGEDALGMGTAIWSLSPALAGTLVNAAGVFLAANTIFSTNLGNGSAIEVHHLLPRKFADRFLAKGLDPENFTIPLPKDVHRLKPDGIHAGPYEDSWNGQWDKFLKENPNATRDDMLEQLAKMRKQFGI